MRKLSQNDLIAAGLMPMCVQIAKRRPVAKEEIPTDEQTIQLVTSVAEIVKVKLTRCCGSITAKDGSTFKIVDKPNVDDLGENEISIEELDQADAEAISAAVDELSGLKKEAAQAAEKFPAGQETVRGTAPNSPELRSAADEPAGTQPA